MKERPILFSTPMVQAILEGRKTQTRRIKYKCDVGDVLWVRETFNCLKLPIMENIEYWYKADENLKRLNPDDKWKPSIFMPRAAARIFLRVKAVRKEPLQNITEEDAINEGVETECMNPSQTIFHNENIECLKINCLGCDKICVTGFMKLWNSLNAKRGCSWDSNPLVKVIEFERIHNYGGKNGIF